MEFPKYVSGFLQVEKRRKGRKIGVYVILWYCKSLIFSEFSVFDLNAKLKGR